MQTQECKQVLSVLTAQREALEELGVKSLALFGSYARGEAGPQSDIDLLVEFVRPVGLFEFLEVKAYLERLLDRPVALVTPAALRPQLRDRILREAIHAA